MVTALLGISAVAELLSIISDTISPSNLKEKRLSWEPLPLPSYYTVSRWLPDWTTDRRDRQSILLEDRD